MGLRLGIRVLFYKHNWENYTISFSYPFVSLTLFVEFGGNKKLNNITNFENSC
jgi:hypothetical protein